MTEPKETTSITVTRGWGNLVTQAYEQEVRRMLDSPFAKMMREERERRQRKHEEWWAQASLAAKARYKAQRGKRWAKRQPGNFRYWLSNKIYKHPECDW